MTVGTSDPITFLALKFWYKTPSHVFTTCIIRKVCANEEQLLVVTFETKRNFTCQLSIKIYLCVCHSMPVSSKRRYSEVHQ